VDIGENAFGLSVRPPEEDGPRQIFCESGRYGLPELAAGNRLTQPLVREDGRLVPASWDEAIEAAVKGLSRVSAGYGSGALLVSGGGELSCEEAERLAALGRGGLHARTGSLALFAAGTDIRALDRVGRVTRSSATYEDLYGAGCVLVVGEDPMEANPVAAARLRRAVREGAKIIAITSAPTRVTELADLWLDARRDTAHHILTWMLQGLMEESGRNGLCPDCGVDPARAQQALDILTSVEGPVVAVMSLDARLDRSQGALPVLMDLVEKFSGGRPGAGVLLTSVVPNLDALVKSPDRTNQGIDTGDLA